jgi:arylsulfatase A-like enzyme
LLFPLYLASLGLSAGIVGLFGRRLLASTGYVSNFDAGIAAAIMIAGGYILLQSAFGAVIQLIKPYKGKGPHLTEMLSLLSAFILTPYLLNLTIPWPHPKLADMEPLIFFAAFAGVHGFLKLATLFAATQAPAATQIRVLPYVALAVLAYFGAQSGFSTWYESIAGGRAATLAPPEAMRVGDTYGWASNVTEGLQYPLEANVDKNEHITLRWAIPEGASESLETLFVTCTFYGADAEGPLDTWKDTVSMERSNWTTQRIPADTIPESAVRMELFWNSEEESEWVRQTGLRPTHASGATVLLSGPYVHHAPTEFERPNIVIVLVEGLGADHMELFGYGRQTTPKLSQFAKRSSVWETTFTACPDAYSTALTLVTGVSPLAHGNTDASRAPLPDGLTTLTERMREAGYVTVAFTEGDGSDGKDLSFGSGFERGFELFNSAYPESAGKGKGKGPAPLVPQGSRVTLKRAADWIAQHHEEERYLVFIRLRELRKPFPLKRYGKGFIKPWETVPRPLDVYDTALHDVDKQLGLFTERLREMGSFDDTCLVVTSPYGLDFSEPDRGVWRRGGPGIPRLTEESLRVPLIISMPEGISRTRRSLVSLNALGRTLSDFAGVSLSPPAQVPSLLDYTTGGEPVSVMGDPMALSLRTKEWRYNWQSGRSISTKTTEGTVTTLGLYNIDDYHASGQNKNFASREPSIASRYREQLEGYLDGFSTATNQ